MSATVESRVEFAELAAKLQREFHLVYGHPIREELTVVSPDEAKLRAVLLLEEAEEYEHARDAGDVIEMADALGDIVVIATGSCLVYGFNLPARVRNLGAPRWSLASAIDAATGPFVDVDGLGQAFAAVVVLAYGEAQRFGIPLAAVLREIHDSNMTKLDTDGSVIRREDGKILKGPNFRPPDLAPILTAAGVKIPGAPEA